jgi:hypothetical protein
VTREALGPLARIRAAALAAWLLVVDQDTLIGAALEVVLVVFLGLVLLGLLTGGLS